MPAHGTSMPTMLVVVVVVVLHCVLSPLTIIWAPTRGPADARANASASRGPQADGRAAAPRRRAAEPLVRAAALPGAARPALRWKGVMNFPGVEAQRYDRSRRERAPGAGGAAVWNTLRP